MLMHHIRFDQTKWATYTERRACPEWLNCWVHGSEILQRYHTAGKADAKKQEGNKADAKTQEGNKADAKKPEAPKTADAHKSGPNFGITTRTTSISPTSFLIVFD